jgi:hypothetical protein
MSSWFSAASLPTSVTDAWKEVNERVQQSIPVDKKLLLEKLSLESPELKEERIRLEAEEYRKEKIHEYLSELLPWETKDEEREILVEDCKESILALSVQEKTFVAPFVLPDPNMEMFIPFEVVYEEEDKDKTYLPQQPSAPATKEDLATLRKEMQDKLQKLEPLPPLLQHFDLDAHVGLIQRLLIEDPNLKEIHACLAGAGEREYIFWRNYFFHCACIREEIGLSMDEIWATKPLPASVEEEKAKVTAEASVTNSSSSNKKHTPTVDDDDVSQEVTFDSNDVFSQQPDIIHNNIIIHQKDQTETFNNNNNTNNSSTSSEYQIVEKDAAYNDNELDDLEAEIARELGED